MADATYQPKVYKAQGGAELVITSSGTLTLEGTQNVASGGTLAVASGGAITIASGGSITAASGGGVRMTPQTVSSSATTITAEGVSVITGTTAGPTFLIANPVTGGLKFLNLTATSSGVTHRAIIAPASTGVSFGTTGQNQITLATSALRNVCLVGVSTSAYRVFGVFTSTMGGLGNVTT